MSLNRSFLPSKSHRIRLRYPPVHIFPENFAKSRSDDSNHPTVTVLGIIPILRRHHERGGRGLAYDNVTHDISKQRENDDEIDERGDGRV